MNFLPKVLGDCVSDSVMMEVSRRLQAYIQDNVEPDIIRSEEAPQDKTKLWYVPSTKKLYIYDASTGTWAETNVDNISVCISPDTDTALAKDESGCLILDLSKAAGATEIFNGAITADGSGNATKSVVLFNWEDINATVEVMFKSDPGAGARWWISDQSVTSVTVTFAGLTASTEYQIRIVARKT